MEGLRDVIKQPHTTGEDAMPPDYDGAVMLDELRVKLEGMHPQFDFDNGASGQPRAIEVRRHSGQLVALWSRDGRTLLFSAAPTAPRAAQSVDEALSITHDFLAKLPPLRAR